ncbi:MAG: SBBP repeat-containing protein, partial [Bacteroidota bacterium]
MKTRILLLILMFASSFLLAQNDSIIVQEWAATYSSQDSIYNAATAIDVNGNIYVTGFTYSSVSQSDITTLKYDASGNLLWAKDYNGTGNNRDQATGICFDNAGNVYVTGYTSNASNNNDYVTIKYSATGTQLWAAIYDNGSHDIPRAIKSDVSGNIYVTGESTGTNGRDYATVKYDQNGNELWVKRFDNGSNDYASAMALDNSGNIYVTGRSYVFDFEYVTIKYLPDGTQDWQATYGSLSHGNDWATAIALDNNNNIYVTGFSLDNLNDGDMITVKYSSSGVQLWDKVFDDNNSNGKARSITVDNIGGVYIAGDIKATNSTIISTIKYNDQSGDIIWQQNHYMTGIVETTASKITTDGNNGIYIAASTGTNSNLD